MKKVSKVLIPILQVLIIVLILTLTLIIIFSAKTFSDDVINFEWLAYAESCSNPKAYNPKTKATGLYQITPICLKDYNLSHEKRYKMKDMFDVDKSYKVAWWYINIRIPELLKHYGYQVDIINILRAYNSGVKRISKDYKETNIFIKRYFIKKQLDLYDIM